MSQAEPFMPFHEPPREPDPMDREIDADVDVFLESAVDDPDAERAAAHMLESEGKLPFRRPEPGARLSPEQLDEDLEQF